MIRGARALRVLTTVAAAFSVVAVGLPSRAQSGRTGSFVVKVAVGASADDVARTYGASVSKTVSGLSLSEINAAPGFASQLRAQLALDPRVVYSEPEATVALPEATANPVYLVWDANSVVGGYANQGAYHQIDLTFPSRSKVQSNPIVAIIDTGVDFNHPALAGRLLAGRNYVESGTAPNDILDGVNNAAYGHGTMIAGIIAKVAPDATILPLKALNADGTGSIIDVVHAINYAVRHGASVINMSFGTSVNSAALLDAVNSATEAGVVVVASAGNDATGVAHFPAAYDSVIGVGAVEANDVLSVYSNYGVNVQLVAPGSGIRSAYPGGGYATWSGTSFAAPFAAGEAAEIAAVHPSWSAYRITRQMTSTADSVDYANHGYAGRLGAGILDFAGALH